MHSLRRSRFGLLAAGSIVLSGLGANGAMAVATPSTASVVTGSDALVPPGLRQHHQRWST